MIKVSFGLNNPPKEWFERLRQNAESLLSGLKREMLGFGWLCKALLV